MDHYIARLKSMDTTDFKDDEEMLLQRHLLQAMEIRSGVQVISESVETTTTSTKPRKPVKRSANGLQSVMYTFMHDRANQGMLDTEMRAAMLEAGLISEEITLDQINGVFSKNKNTWNKLPNGKWVLRNYKPKKPKLVASND